jgi:hypothetical protein
MKLGGLALFALASASVIACTFIVNGEVKDLSGTCQIGALNDNACGQCVAQHCQANVDSVCTNDTIIGDLKSCVQNPSPGSAGGGTWGCEQFIGDAALSTPSNNAAGDSLRHCVANNCVANDACKTCTIVDAGTSACGKCINTSCGAMLKQLGDNYCCSGSVNAAIGECVAQSQPHCVTFLSEWEGGAPTDASTSGCTEAQFAYCVVTNCQQDCPVH